MDVTYRELHPTEAGIWLLLFRDARGDIATAGIADLAERAGCSARWARKALVSLREKKLIEVVKKGRSGRYVSTYRITPLLPAKPLPKADPEGSTGEL
jgi:predicted ArsR family transcriptional regulator